MLVLRGVIHHRQHYRRHHLPRAGPVINRQLLVFLNKLCIHCLNRTLYECFIVGKQSIAGRKLYTKYDVLLAILFLIVQCIMILIIVF